MDGRWKIRVCERGGLAIKRDEEGWRKGEELWRMSESVTFAKK